MEYNEFCECIREELCRMLGDTYTVRVDTVVKNNQVRYNAIVISKTDTRVTPTIYLERYYEEYVAGKNISDICLSVLVHYENSRDDLDVDVDKLMEYEYMKERIYVKAVNTALNGEQLDNVPHEEYYDLSMVVYAEVGEPVSHSAIMKVVNHHLKIWGVSKEELFRQAIYNTREKKKRTLRQMSEVLKSMLERRLRECEYEEGEDLELDNMVECAKKCIEDSKGNEMYVLTNRSGYGGAVYMLFGDIMSDVAELIGDDIYILPSSVHELIIVPKGSNSNREDLENLVKSVNDNEMNPREILSNTVYVYQRDKGIQWS